VLAPVAGRVGDRIEVQLLSHGRAKRGGAFGKLDRKARGPYYPATYYPAEPSE